MITTLIVSRYNEDLAWLDHFQNPKVIYNKGKKLGIPGEIIRPNFGGNQFDIFHFIHENYHNLPDYMAFVQGYPFDHCSFELMKDRINACAVGPLSNTVVEHNNSWYISKPWIESRLKGSTKWKNEPTFSSFDEYASKIFKNYLRLEVLSFPQGSQILVSKEVCLSYSKEFWRLLMEIPLKDEEVNGGPEAHLIERSIELIFTNRFKGIV